MVQWVQHEAKPTAALEATFSVVTELGAVARPLTLINVYNHHTPSLGIGITEHTHLER